MPRIRRVKPTVKDFLHISHLRRALAEHTPPQQLPPAAQPVEDSPTEPDSPSVTEGEQL